MVDPKDVVSSWAKKSHFLDEPSEDFLEVTVGGRETSAKISLRALSKETGKVMGPYLISIGREGGQRPYAISQKLRAMAKFVDSATERFGPDGFVLEIDIA